MVETAVEFLQQTRQVSLYANINICDSFAFYSSEQFLSFLLVKPFMTGSFSCLSDMKQQPAKKGDATDRWWCLADRGRANAYSGACMHAW